MLDIWQNARQITMMAQVPCKAFEEHTSYMCNGIERLNVALLHGQSLPFGGSP